MARLDDAPRLHPVAVQAGRDLLEPLLRRAELTLRDPEQPVRRRVDPFLEAQLPGEPVRTEPERGPAARRNGVAQVGDVLLQGIDGHRGGVGQIPQQVHVVEVAERLREIALDERQDAAERLDADAGEEARRIGDVPPGGVEEPRRLPQLRNHSAGPVRHGRVVEQHLSGEAVRQRLRIVQRTALPGADVLQCEQAGLNAVGQHPAIELLLAGQGRRLDAVEAPGPPAELANLRLDAGPAEILQQIVVQMDAVGGRRGRRHLVQVRQVLVDEMGQRFGGMRWRTFHGPS